MNGPAPVAFAICTPGCGFHVPLDSDGRLIPVCQSTSVRNVRPYRARRTPPGAVESGINTSSRWFDVWSFTAKLLPQLQRPMRSGVSNLRVVVRASTNIGKIGRAHV